MALEQPIIDVHTHVWGGRFDADSATLLSMADRYQIEWLGVIPLPGGAYPSVKEIAAGNAYVARMQQAHPDRVKGFCYVNPRHGRQALDQLRQGVEEYELPFIKLWIASLCDHPRVHAIMEKAIEYRRTILVHAFHKSVGQLADESDATHVAHLAQRYPQARILMAHMAGDFFWGVKAIQHCPNVWVDMSGTYCEAGMVPYALSRLGARRVLFGSDAPGAAWLNNLAKVVQEIDDPAQRRLILHDNAAGLLP